MSWRDRTYYEAGYGRRFQSVWAGGSVVKWLLAANAIIFLLDFMLRGSMRGSDLAPSHWGYFSVDKGIYGLQLWRWVTYQFIHGDFFHILFNMIGLYFFGPLMERWWGSRRFLAFYLLCGVMGAVVLSLFALMPGVIPVGPETSLVGASAAVFGTVVGCAVLYPHQRVMLLIPPVPMSMRTMALLFVGLSAFSLLFGSANAGGEAAHLGGAVLGFVLVKRSRLLDWADGSPGGWKRWRKMSKVNLQHRRQRELQAEVDRILDKVRDKGLHSLSRRERKTLQKATEQKRSAG